MTGLTIITPVGRQSDISKGYLHRAAVSVSDLAHVLAREGEPVAVEWIISPDGLIRDEEIFSLLAPFRSAGRLKINVLESVPEKLGPAVARNRALREASGCMLLALDADDFLEPAAVASLVATLALERVVDEVGFVAGLTMEVDEGGAPIVIPRVELPTGFLPRDIYLHYAMNHGFWPWHPAATLMATGAVRKVGGWATQQPYWDRGEDTALLARLSHHVPGFWTPEIIHYYRINPEGLTATFPGDLEMEGLSRMNLLAQECELELQRERVSASPSSSRRM